MVRPDGVDHESDRGGDDVDLNLGEDDDDVDHDRDGGGDDVDPDRGNGDDDVETVGRRRRVSWRGHLGDCIAPVVSKMSAILFY